MIDRFVGLPRSTSSSINRDRDQHRRRNKHHQSSSIHERSCAEDVILERSVIMVKVETTPNSGDLSDRQLTFTIDNNGEYYEVI
jgi:hypothetical protein